MASKGDRQLVTTVAPKAWRDGAKRQVLLSELSIGHTELALWEGDRVHFMTPGPETEAVVGAALRASRNVTDNWDEGESLLMPEVPIGSSAEPDGLPQVSHDATANLLRLFQRIDLLHPESDSPLVREQSSPLYRPLTSRHFLDEVERRLNQARRGYRRVNEERWSIRGRVTAESVGLFLATGGTKLRCTYDELTESTQLLGAIATALELIADGRGPSSLLPQPFNERSLRHDAIRLRRALEGVDALPLTSVLTTLARLRPTRLDQPWLPALRLAGVVLRGGALVAKASRERQTQAVELSVHTDKLWELIVNQALNRAGIGKVLEQKAQEREFDLNRDPWVAKAGSGVSRVRPDNVILTADSVLVVDAKYKLVDKPSLEDRYQMFAYSHLVRRADEAARVVALVYPGSGATSVRYRGRDDASNAVRLLCVQVPFPMPADVVTAQRWDSYLEKVSVHLRAALSA